LTLVDDKNEMQEFDIDVIGEILNSIKKKTSLGVWILCLHFNHAYSKKCLTTWNNHYSWPIKKFHHAYLQPICSPNFSFMGEVGKSKENKLGCEKYFCWVTY
jgi:hypothetical protein